MKIPKALVLERKIRVWDMRQKGFTYEHIAKELKISSNGVSRILQRLTKKYAERHLEDVDRIKAEQVSQLEHVSSEAMQAWERSKKSANLVRQKKDINHDGKQLGANEQTVESRDQDGDPRYLTAFMKAKEDIRKITGADAPIKNEITGKDGAPVSIEERADRLVAILEQARARRDSARVADDSAGTAEVETTTRAADEGILQQS